MASEVDQTPSINHDEPSLPKPPEEAVTRSVQEQGNADLNLVGTTLKEADNDGKEEGEIDDDDDEEQAKVGGESVYCICRTSETNRFMIGCDKCNEWYHGDCISITEEYAKRIKQFYCLMCRDKDPTLEIKFKEKKVKIAKKPEVKEEKPRPVARQKSVDGVEFDANRSDPEYRPNRNYFESDDDMDDEDFYEPASKKNRRHVKDKSSKTTSKSKNRRQTKGGDKRNRARRTARPRHKEEGAMHKKREQIVEVKEGPKQCYGPGCVNVAKRGSKYCSDDCGIKLATNRIVEILPHRIRQWQSTPCVSDDISHKELDEIRQEQQKARRILNELDERQHKLEKLIEQGKSVQPFPEDEPIEGENEAESELNNIYCVSCGHEVNHRQALKHMERCFNKYESQTSFGSIFKTKIEGQTVFCDFYNPHQHTYCKRLRILCPEHSKDPKIADDEVCGCPLVTNVFEETGTFCRVLKKKCNKHYCWEKLRRAELDTERIQQWLKLDDLFEKEQKIRYTLSNRHGILGLMLHQTLAHQLHDEGESYKSQPAG